MSSTWKGPRFWPAFAPGWRRKGRAGVNSRFVYAGGQAIGEYDASGGLIRRYVPGPGLDDYAAYTAGTGGSITRSWPMPDPLGSVTAVTDGAGVATQINRYDEYGVPQAGFSGRFGYAGSMYLNRAMAAPWNMRNRQYNPNLGRFLQTDPIGIAGGVNLYAYVGGDPVNLVDPWGLTPAPRIVPCNSGPHPSMIPGRCVATPQDCVNGGGTYRSSTNQCVIDCTPGATCITDPFELDRFLERLNRPSGLSWSGGGGASLSTMVCSIPPLTIGWAADGYRGGGISVAYNFNFDLGRGQFGFTTLSGVGVGAGRAMGGQFGVVSRSSPSGGASVNVGGSAGAVFGTWSYNAVYNVLGTDRGFSQLAASRGGAAVYANLQVNAGLRTPALWGRGCR